MIDWEKYDPARDADENVSHFCNSLNATCGELEHRVAYFKAFGDDLPAVMKIEDLERIADYIERAQATITHLRRKVVELGGSLDYERDDGKTDV